MPRFSQFAPLGQLAFRASPTYSEVIYHSLIGSFGGEKNFDPSGEQSARAYSMAMVIGSLRYTIERAGNQFDPAKVYDLLPVHEQQYGLLPPLGATLRERRAALALKREASLGSRRGNISQVLERVVGDAFISHVVTPVDEVVMGELVAGANYDPPSTPARLIKLTEPVWHTSPTKVTVGFTHVSGDSTPLQPDQRIVMQPGDGGRGETVIIESATASTFTAQFLSVHDKGSLALTGPFWMPFSTRRHHRILITKKGGKDAEVRRKINDQMRTLTRAVSTWSILEEEGEPGSRTAGPFKVGVGLLGITSIGEVTF